jgi:branched-chain amino acid aminotransferase
VTRELVIQWCRQEGLTVRVEPLPMSILERVEEVFITSSTKDVLAIHAIDDRALAAPGPATARVAEIFARLSIEQIDP